MYITAAQSTETKQKGICWTSDIAQARTGATGRKLALAGRWLQPEMNTDANYSSSYSYSSSSSSCIEPNQGLQHSWYGSTINSIGRITLPSVTT
jgi:uncharacterized RmlC-like cupin family protein